MKKKIIALFALIAVLGLAIAAFAYAQTTSESASSSCCQKDSCPMKKADHEKSGEHAKGEHHKCCGDSWPMKKESGEAKAATVSTTESNKNCCDNCKCCKGKHEPIA